MRGLIVVGPQPADSGLFARAPIGLGRAIVLATEPSTTKPLREGLAGIRQRLKERRAKRAEAAAGPASLSAAESDFLREIGAL